MAVHVPGVENGVADAVSRDKLNLCALSVICIAYHTEVPASAIHLITRGRGEEGRGLVGGAP